MLTSLSLYFIILFHNLSGFKINTHLLSITCVSCGLLYFCLCILDLCFDIVKYLHFNLVYNIPFLSVICKQCNAVVFYRYGI